ncbi:MAG: peptide-methionine (S)-S-oxide reductase [Gammaproteobacteria bacterium]|nr:MAG: peptide-methionine (S)-S-oxide reductase [Gammaproteobacteria bacterium]
MNTQATETSTLPTQATIPEQATVAKRSIVLGAGCFWGAEKRFEAIDGVLDAVSGYADGRGVSPTYSAITQKENKFNSDNYAEVVQVTYNANRVDLETLLKHFFEHHDPTQGDRQGNDVGTQYRSTILYQNAEEKQTAERVRDAYQQLLSQAGYGKITTKIAPLDAFHPTEEYHQDYLKKNPNGYCPDHSTGVTFEAGTKTDSKIHVDNSALLTGKHIVVLEAPHCPYCEAFKQQIGNSYQGDIALHYRLSAGLDGLQIHTETWATPTIFFIEDGKEVFAHQGLMTAEKFYQALGAFQLGKDSKAYEVAFEDGTESRFCRQYEQFKNTGDGVFVDAISGEALFDTKDRFNSGSGWLSFTQAIPNTTIEIPDNRFGMRRIEVRAKTSNIHLGHVFDDGPNGTRRFCINANVLKFKPRGEK